MAEVSGKKSLGSMHLLAVSPASGRQKSAQSEFFSSETLRNFNVRASGNSGSYVVSSERQGERLIEVNGEKSKFFHIEILKHERLIAERSAMDVPKELAKLGISLTRDELLQVSRLKAGEVLAFDGPRQSVLLHSHGGSIKIFSAGVFIAFVPNCPEFNGQDVFLNDVNTLLTSDFDGAVIRIRPVDSAADMPHSTYSPITGVYAPNFYQLSGGEACPAEISRQIFHAIQNEQWFDSAAAAYWLSKLAAMRLERERTRRNRWELFDGISIAYSSTLLASGASPGNTAADSWGGGGNSGAGSIQHFLQPSAPEPEFGAAELMVCEPATFSPPFLPKASNTTEKSGKGDSESDSSGDDGNAKGSQCNSNSTESRGAGSSGALSAGAEPKNSKSKSHDIGAQGQTASKIVPTSTNQSGPVHPEGQPTPLKLSQKSSFKPVPIHHLKKLRAVIFDLDGVVVDSEKAHLATFNAVLRPFGVKISAAAWKRNYTGVGSLAIMQDVVARNGIKADVGLLVGKRAEAYHDYVEKHGLPSMPGFMEFFADLQRHGVQVAIASGGHRPHILSSMMAIGIPRIPFVGLEDVRNRKPAPDVFLLAAEQLGVKPSECMVFEDSLAGLQAAASAAMPCIALATTLPRKELQGKAALIITNFRSPSLRRALAKLVIKRKGASRQPQARPSRLRRSSSLRPARMAARQKRGARKRA